MFAGHLAALSGLLRGQHAGLYINGACKFTPARPAGELLLVVTEIEQAAPLESRLLTRLRGELLPQPKALCRHWQLPGVSILLPAPTPVSTRLFGADAALLYQNDLHAALSQVIGGKSADNATANHNHISFCGEIWRSLYRK